MRKRAVKLGSLWLYRLHILNWGIFLKKCKKLGSRVFTCLLSSSFIIISFLIIAMDTEFSLRLRFFSKPYKIPSHNRLSLDNFLHYKIKDDWVSTCCDGEKQWKRLPLNSTKANLIEFVTWFFFSLSTLVWKAARNLHMYYTLRPLKVATR